MEIKLEAFGDTQLDRELLRFQDRGDDFSPMFESLAEDFYSIERAQFASEGRFASAGWAPLSSAYAARKARLHPGKTILRATDALFESLTGGAGSTRRITNDEMYLAGAAHGIFHQRGTRRMPRRRPVELRIQDRNRWIKTMQRFIVTGEVSGGLTGMLSF